MSQPPIVELQNVEKRYGTTLVLDGISFTLAAGECTALLGPSGCGKTTTLRMLAGFEAPDAGTVTMAGRDVRRLRPYERSIGLVFQDYALFPHMTVAQNIAYGMRRRGLPASEHGPRTAELLELVHLGGLDRRRPDELSGGQQQRVAIARALAPRPDLLLLDEPLSNLDARLRESLRREMKDILQAVGTTSLLVTHDQEEALSMADRIILMNRGRIRQVGTPERLYEAPLNRFAAQFLGHCNWLAGTHGALNPAGVARFEADDGLVLRARWTGGGSRRPAGRLGVAIRAERLEIVRPGEPQPEETNRFSGVVAGLHYHGAERTVEVALPAGRRLDLRERADRGEGRVLGSPVLCQVRVGDCLLTEEDEPA